MAETRLEKMATAKTTKIFGVRDRWVCMVFYYVAIFLGSCTYYGWQHMQYVLVINTNYEDACDPGTTRPPGAERDSYLCEGQQNAIDIAYTIASSCEFSGGLVAGLLFDNFGPVITASCGIVLHFVSWPLVLAGGSSALSHTGFAMMGLSVNLVAIPALIIIRRFPRHVFLQEALNLAAQTLTSFLTPTFYSILQSNPSWTWSNIMSVYLPIAACFAVVYLFLLPFNQSQVPMEIEKVTKKLERPVFDKFWKYLIKPEYVCYFFWYCLMIMQFSMIGVKLDSVAGKEVSEFTGWIFWLQAPLGVCGGLLNEKVSSLSISWALTVTLTLGYTFIIANLIYKNHYDGSDWSASNEIMNYIGATLYVLSNSYIYTVKYTWVTTVMPISYLGTLTGCIGVGAGLLQLINTVLIELDDMTMLITYVSLGAVQLFLLGYVQYRNKKGKGDYREPIGYLTESGEFVTSVSISKSDSSDSSGSSGSYYSSSEDGIELELGKNN